MLQYANHGKNHYNLTTICDPLNFVSMDEEINHVNDMLSNQLGITASGYHLSAPFGSINDCVMAYAK